ncbi:hypothetical protein VIC_003793 [Vibrio coralliilyticus ATCC BAA-450]|nr:hypothetical protein VIC_003793 [Vibrio coralliilyticus ATCC BAA-450]
MEEALANGLNTDSIEPNVKQALVTLQQVSTPAFQAMISEMLNSETDSPNPENSQVIESSNPKNGGSFGEKHLTNCSSRQLTVGDFGLI